MTHTGMCSHSQALTHTHNQFPFCHLHYIYTHQQHWAENKSKVWHFTSILHFHESQFISRRLRQAPSLIRDQWRSVRLRNERHITIPVSLHQESGGSTGSNVTSETVVPFVSKHSSAICWKVGFLRDGGNSQGRPAVRDAGFLYIAVKLLPDICELQQ